MENQKAKIWHVTMHDKDNYMTYSDMDSSVNFFHGMSLTTKSTIEWLQKDGADRIVVDPINNEDSPRYDKRAARFAKALGYKLEKTVERRHYQVNDNICNFWNEIKYVLTRQGAAA